MAPFHADLAAEWTKQIQDTLAGNSGMREGLHDDEALPLVDWGADQAKTVAERLADADAPPPDAEQVAMAAHTLGRLLTRITWVVTYRSKKDAAWLTRTFAKINALSQEVFGPDAPTLSDDEIAAWIAVQAGRSNGELVRDLIARLTPKGAGSAPQDLPAEPDPPPADSSDAQEKPGYFFWDESHNPPTDRPSDSPSTQGTEDA